MKRMIPICALLLVTAGMTQVRSEELKIYISVDMEGIGGVSTWDVQAGSKGSEYEKFRKLMTAEVNAAIEGAFEAGATEVLVSDSHGNGQNLDMELLDERVRLIRAWPRPLSMMHGLDSTFDAVVFIGYHANEGRAGAILAHTMSSGSVFEIKLNDTVVAEAGFNAAIAGDFGVPVVFLSGDQAICEDTERLLGPIETFAVKEATGFFSAMMMHPGKARRGIREGVKRGIGRRDEIRPFKMKPPVEVEITFKKLVIADVLSSLPGVERPRGNAVRFAGADMLEATGFLEVALYLNVD
jgi:D-amino peptidase